jgi:hypothetical protein
MRPTPPSLGACFPLTDRHFAPFSERAFVLSLCTGKRSVLGFIFLPEVQYGEPVTELRERKNGSKHNLMSFLSNQVL